MRSLGQRSCCGPENRADWGKKVGGVKVAGENTPRRPGRGELADFRKHGRKRKESKGKFGGIPKRRHEAAQGWPINQNETEEEED